LEILGYRHDRAAMLSVAARHALEEWGMGPDLDLFYREADLAWQTQGTRPANHPRRRLQQYASWVAASPRWPEQWRQMAANWDKRSVAATQTPRQALELKSRREQVAGELVARAISGSRLDNLICDGLLPLLAAETGQDLYACWFHWFMGDTPLEVSRALRALGLSGKGVGPQTHGWAQGLLGWIIERDARASGCLSGPLPGLDKSLHAPVSLSPYN